MIKKVVFCTSNNPYIPKCVVSLISFMRYNKNYDAYIIGTSISEDNQKLIKKFNIKFLQTDLSSSFHRKWKYPIECFYHFYGPKIFHLMGYKYSVFIDGDVYCNNKLNFDWSSIEHIGGTTRFTAGHFLGRIDNREKITKKFKIKQRRLRVGHIDPGVIYYNNEGLTKFRFFEKIVQIYKKSIRYGVPRKGDDSLLALAVILMDKLKVKYLPKKFNLIVKKSIEKKCYLTINNGFITEAFFMHMNRIKPWSVNKVPPSYTYKFFIEKWRETMINNFSQAQVRKYFPQLYKDIRRVPINFYWFRNTPKPNFGDEITPYLVKKVTGYNITNVYPPSTKERVIIMTGSIMRLCDKNTIVWGSGIRDIDQNIKKGKLIRAVRGPLTRKRLLRIGCHCPPIYGDPGMLLPNFYSPEDEKYKKKYVLGVIPHISQYNKVKELYKDDDNCLVINLHTSDIESVVDNIIKCKKTVSSSLHGLIVSNAYNIPTKWIKFDDNIKGDYTKYYDYFYSIGRTQEDFIDARFYKKISVNALINRVKSYEIKINLEKFIDNGIFDENGVKKYILYQLKK